MKVYVLLGIFEQDRTENLGVFITAELAEQSRDVVQDSPNGYNGFSIEEHEVEGVCVTG